MDTPLPSAAPTVAPDASASRPPRSARAGLSGLWRALGRPAWVLLALLAAVVVFAPHQAAPTLRFVGTNLLGIAPVLLLAAAMGAAIQAASAETLVARAFQGHRAGAIVVAALAGALSPLCSCGVVPLIAGLLAAGVPLAPVMAFWLASPIMDPAMFVLTAGTIGAEFAVAKTLAAIGIGLLGGATATIAARMGDALRPHRAAVSVKGADAWAQRRAPRMLRFWRDPQRLALFRSRTLVQARQLAGVLAIAFALESLMLAYLPAGSVAAWLDGSSAWSIPVAAALGIPAYLNGVAAVGLVRGLIDLGLSPAVGLTFMVAGGVTSVPAALAVWSLVRPRVFALYLATGFAGAIASGYAYAAWLAWTA